jgi:cob(I)alamin adenosyltransferase
MFDNKHKDHEINHLEKIYTIHVDNIKNQLKNIQDTLQDLGFCQKGIEDKIEIIRKFKQDKTVELEELFDQFKAKLDSSMRSKLLFLINTKSQVSDKIEKLSTIKSKVNK